MKVCSRKDCKHKGKPQLKSNFNKRTIAKDKLKSYCKDCEKYYGGKRGKRTLDLFLIEKTKFDRRIKLTLKDKEEILRLRGLGGYSQRKLARMFNVSRRTIQFILDPQKRIENVKRRNERGGSKQYYNKDKWREVQKEHRNYKKSLLIGGEVKLKIKKERYKNRKYVEYN